jgi:hypothetical protein
VRFSVFAILTAGVFFFAIDFKVLTCCVVHARLLVFLGMYKLRGQKNALIAQAPLKASEMRPVAAEQPRGLPDVKSSASHRARIASSFVVALAHPRNRRSKRLPNSVTAMKFSSPSLAVQGLHPRVGGRLSVSL